MSAPAHTRSAQHRVGTALAMLGLVGVVIATLAPSDDPRGRALLTPLLCLVCGDQGGADVAVNLLLFLPFAIGLRLSGRSWVTTVALSALVSFTVELLQLTVIPGRDASLSDLVSNATSGAIGATLGRFLPAVVAPPPRRAAGLLAGAAGLWLAVLGLGAWLLSPWVPPGRLMSRWAHVAPGSDVFDGRVAAVRLNGRSMPADGDPPDSALNRARTAAAVVALDADVVSGRPVAVRSWIYMFRVPSGGVVTLSQHRQSAVLTVPSRALRFRMWAPTLTLEDGFPADPGIPVHLTASEQGRRLRLTSAYGGRERAVELALSPGYAWVLVEPFDLTLGTGVRWITGLCLALLALPLGYSAAWLGRRSVGLVALAVALAAGLLAIPALTGYPPVHPSEWLGGMLGAAAGWALRPVAAYLQTRCASPSASESSSS
jgi:hypothetical protein